MYNLLVSECCTGYGHVAQRNVPQLLGQSGHPVLVVLIHVAQSPNLQETLRTELKESRGACWGGSSSERSGPLVSFCRYTTVYRQLWRASFFLIPLWCWPTGTSHQRLQLTWSSGVLRVKPLLYGQSLNVLVLSLHPGHWGFCCRDVWERGRSEYT